MRESKTRALPLGYTPTSLVKSKGAGADAPALPPCVYGVGDGTRTRDTRNHNPMLYQLNYIHHRRERQYHVSDMVRQKGLEPPAYCLEGSCSIQLSYWRVWSG